MDHSSSSSPSSSSQYKGLLHQERDWLSSSASPSTRIDLEDDNDNNNDDSYDHGLDHVRGRAGLGLGLEGGTSSSYGVMEKEHMFDKVVTPSDVGKLNRLVIPKQHAEKYFPLDTSNNNNNNNNNTTTENKAGMLLNFEDRTGKSWRFRYSYWNSSQSYVMTKGWSRFVKEKQLSAGDIVSFQRGVGDEVAKQTFFIDWRRRPLHDHRHYNHHYHHHLGTAFAVHHSFPGWGSSSSTTTTPTLLLRSHPYSSPNLPIWDRSSTNYSNSSNYLSHMNMVNPYASSSYGGSSVGVGGVGASNSVVNYPPYSNNNPTGSLVFLRSSSFSSTSPLSPTIGYNPPNYTLPNHHLRTINSSLALSSDGYHEGGGGSEPTKVYESVPLIQVSPPITGGGGDGSGSGGGAKRSLRLFGVNMDCAPSDNGNGDDGQVISPMGASTISAPSSSSTLNFDLDPK